MILDLNHYLQGLGIPMIEKKTDGLSLWHFESLSKCGGMTHFVSTRQGGFSPPPYDGLNLSFNVGDDPERVLSNRERLARALEAPLKGLTTARQIHDSHIAIVSESMGGKGALDDDQAIPDTDAMVTDVPGICLMVLVADCVPLLLCDPEKGVIGVVHAGWKGTLQGIAGKTVTVLHDAFGCTPGSLLVGIGPSIGPCCYEVGPDVASKIEHVFGTTRDRLCKISPRGKIHFDLWKANRTQLLESGIPDQQIETAAVCTCHHPDRFYSHRFEKGQTGRFGAGIMIR